MTEDETRAQVGRLESRLVREREEAWANLRPLGETVVPYLAEAYPNMRKSGGRLACVFYSISYARTSEAAFRLGLAALSDRATLVRYRACGLLAYSLRKDAIPQLQSLLGSDDPKTVADAKAAIDAIKNMNHHYFVDRGHLGGILWEVNPGDTKK